MKRTRFGKLCLSVACVALAGCNLPGKPKPDAEVPRPDSVTSFHVLYAQNCAGCHGADGQNGPATDLANPVYQALIDDATLRDVIANGEKGTLMPGFHAGSGGSLTDVQIDALVKGIRDRWAKGNVLQGQNAPPYKATGPGNAGHGQQVYMTACARCHGAPDAKKPGPAGSILEGSFLALVNEQTIRNTVIAGRPDIGQPDWRGAVPGHPLTDADVTDVTAWMLSQRPANPGQPYPDYRPTTEPPGESQPQAPAKR